MLDPNANILIVDDMKMVRKSIIRYLETLGYRRVVEAENGLEAVNAFKSQQIDCIFMDLVMPVMSGMDALKKIRAQDKMVPIIMVSSIADQDAIDECNKYGIVGYIVKPLNHTNGPTRIKEILDKADSFVPANA